jgi:hypothetical protein
MIVSLRCDCAFFLEKLEIIMCRLWRPECVARHSTYSMDGKNTRLNGASVKADLHVVN